MKITNANKWVFIPICKFHRDSRIGYPPPFSLMAAKQVYLYRQMIKGRKHDHISICMCFIVKI